MLHSLVEENQIHASNILVVLFELSFQNGLEDVHAYNWLVEWLMALARRDVGGVQKWSLKDILWLELSEFLHTSLHEVQVRGMVLLSDESVLPGSVALMCPKSDQVKSLTLVHSWLSKHDVLHNSREVSQVELVMELLCSGHELWRHSDGQEHIHSGIDDVGR